MFGIRIGAIILFVAHVNARAPSAPNSAIKGRLLTPEEGCGLTEVKNSKIVGGNVAKEGAWPWIAMIGYHDGIMFKCGGSLITSRHVLTAGHCIRPFLRFVRLGGHYRYATSGPYQDINIIHIEKHPEYVENTGTDIAMLYLHHDVDFTDFIRPICLPMNEPIRSQKFINSNPFVAGWGLTSENGTESDYLMQTQIPVLDNELCEELYTASGSDTLDFPDSVICAGNLAGGKGVCNGDSGGPLMLPIHQKGMFPFYQIGVSSFSLDCGEPLSPAGFVSTQYHADWIQKMINKEI